MARAGTGRTSSGIRAAWQRKWRASNGSSGRGSWLTASTFFSFFLLLSQLLHVPLACQRFVSDMALDPKRQHNGVIPDPAHRWCLQVSGSRIRAASTTF